MTEYDYSPEAYDRYLATQARIANWVNDTEHHRADFEPAVGPSTRPTSPPMQAPVQQPRMRVPPMPRQYPHQPMQRQMLPRTGSPYPYGVPAQPPRPMYIQSPPESVSSSEYGEGPGPMPLASLAMAYAPKHAFAPMAIPPPPLQQYMQYAARPQRHHSHSHSSSHSHSRSRGHHSSGYYTVASPPVSSGVHYGGGYPPQQMGHPGYFAVPPQQRPVVYL